MSISRRLPDPDLVRIVKADLCRIEGQCYKMALRDAQCRLPEWTDKVIASGHGDAIDASLPYQEFKSAYLAATEKLIVEVAQAMLLNSGAELEIRLSVPGDCSFIAHVWTLRRRMKEPDDFVFVEPAPVAQKPPIKFDFPSA